MTVEILQFFDFFFLKNPHGLIVFFIATMCYLTYTKVLSLTHKGYDEGFEAETATIIPIYREDPD